MDNNPKRLFKKRVFVSFNYLGKETKAELLHKSCGTCIVILESGMRLRVSRKQIKFIKE